MWWSFEGAVTASDVQPLANMALNGGRGRGTIEQRSRDLLRPSGTEGGCKAERPKVALKAHTLAGGEPS